MENPQFSVVSVASCQSSDQRSFLFNIYFFLGIYHSYSFSFQLSLSALPVFKRVSGVALEVSVIF